MRQTAQSQRSIAGHEASFYPASPINRRDLRRTPTTRHRLWATNDSWRLRVHLARVVAISICKDWQQADRNLAWENGR